MILSTVIETLLKYWPVFPAVFAAGIVDAIAGGGGLITLPVYMLVGLPPHEAIGTNKMSSCMGTTTATYRFAREGYINFRMAVFAVVFALAGSYTGAHISLLISNESFKILMLFILPVTAWFVLRTKNFDVEREPYSFRKTCALSCVIAFVIGVYFDPSSHVCGASDAEGSKRADKSHQHDDQRDVAGGISHKRNSADPVGHHGWTV